MPRLPDPDDALWTFRTANFLVAFFAEEEELDPADSFEFEDDIAFARSGDPGAWFAAVVRVYLLDDEGEPVEVVGSDHLGGCSYRSFEDFYTSHRDPDPANRNTLAMKAQKRVICHYFPDMIATAVDDARRTLRARQDRLSAIRLRH